MFDDDQKDQKLQLGPMWEKSLNSFPAGGEQFEHRVTCEEQSSNIANDS